MLQNLSTGFAGQAEGEIKTTEKELDYQLYREVKKAGEDDIETTAEIKAKLEEKSKSMGLLGAEERLAFRVSTEKLTKLRATLKKYEGTK